MVTPEQIEKLLREHLELTYSDTNIDMVIERGLDVEYFITTSREESEFDDHLAEELNITITSKMVFDFKQEFKPFCVHVAKILNES